MIKTQMYADMRQAIGSYPNTSQLAKYLHWGRDRVRAFIMDLPRLETGQVFYKDVVDKLYERRTTWERQDSK